MVVGFTRFIRLNRSISVVVLFSCAIVFLTGGFVFSASIYVDDDNKTGVYTGAMDSPFAGIRAAIDAVGQTGDVICVAEGLY